MKTAKKWMEEIFFYLFCKDVFHRIFFARFLPRFSRDIGMSSLFPRIPSFLSKGKFENGNLWFGLAGGRVSTRGTLQAFRCATAKSRPFPWCPFKFLGGIRGSHGITKPRSHRLKLIACSISFVSHLQKRHFRYLLS